MAFIDDGAKDSSSVASNERFECEMSSSCSVALISSSGVSRVAAGDITCSIVAELAIGVFSQVTTLYNLFLNNLESLNCECVIVKYMMPR